MVVQAIPLEVWRSMAAQGYTQTDAAADLGVSRQDAVRARRAGVKFPLVTSRVPGFIRAADDMTHPEAAEYLRGVVQVLTWIKGVAHEFPAEWRLTESERRVLGALNAAAPRYLSKDALLNALYFDRRDSDVGQPTIVDVLVCKIRKKLAANDAAIGIETVWGVGYRLVQRARCGAQVLAEAAE